LGRAGYLDLLKDYNVGKQWLPSGANFTSQYQAPQRVFIDHYEEDSNTSTLSSSLAGANTWSAASFSEMFLDTGAGSDFYQETRAGRLSWSVSTHHYQATITSPGLNAGGYSHLAVRIGQSAEAGNTAGNDQNLRIIVQDTSGGSASYTAAAFSRLLYPDTGPMYGGTVRKMVMQTIRVPLSLIRDRVNVNNISAVRLAFDQVGTGVVYFDELEVSN
jgi:hypothetical protein